MTVRRDCLALVGRAPPRLAVEIVSHGPSGGCPAPWLTCLTPSETIAIVDFVSDSIAWARDVTTQCGPPIAAPASTPMTDGGVSASVDAP